MRNIKILFKIIAQICAALWKLFMLALYMLSKIAEGISKLLATISEKFID